jgi:hypothetical protein
LPRFKTGWRPGGKKAEQRISGEYLDAVLDDFSGYIAADELYDGPFCALSIVDNRTFRRLTCEVLDHDPAHADIERFFRTFQAALQRRGLVLRGITTDGWALYPEPSSAAVVRLRPPRARQRGTASGSNRRSGTCFSIAICSCSTFLLQLSGGP